MKQVKYYGYARVSTDKQDTARQIDAINRWSLEHNVNVEVFEDHISGKTFHRPAYEEMKTKVEAGDYVIIKEVDRLGRDWDGIKAEYKWFLDHDINLIFTDCPLLSSAADPNQHMTLDNKLIRNITMELFCYLAQNEREKLSKRTKEGLAAAKARGTKLGRPVDDEYEEVKQMRVYRSQGLTLQQIAEIYGCSKQNVGQRIRDYERKLMEGEFD